MGSNMPAMFLVRSNRAGVFPERGKTESLERCVVYRIMQVPVTAQYAVLEGHRHSGVSFPSALADTCRDRIQAISASD